MLFRTLFGLDSLPFRICVFATMAANVVFLSAVTHRITGSRLAGFAAPVLWTANAALVTVMTWNSSYNEALCGLFLLGALWFWIRWTETGRKRFYWCQLAIFVVGFGALETNIVYPAIAGAYTIFVAPRERRRVLLRSTIPLFVISLVYYAIHWAVAPLLKSGPYALHFDRRVIPSFLRYWKWSLLPSGWDDLGRNHRVGQLIFWTCTAALIVFVIRQMARRNWIPLFFLAWFVVTLAPVIGLPNHVSDYYLTLPLIGLAMLGGYGVAKASELTWQWRAVAVIATVAYLGAMVPAARFSTRWWSERTRNVRGLVLGVEAAHQSHPRQAILLSDVTSELYNDAVGHSPFILLGLNNVYLTPQSKSRIHPEDDLADLEDVILPAGPTLRALADDQVVVYSVAGDHLRNITGVFERVAFHELRDENPRRVDVGNSLFAYLLGPTWHALEANYRWMPKRATVRLGGPRSAKERLYLEGVCPEAQLRNGPVRLSVSIDGTPLGGTQILAPEVNFHRLFSMPAALIGRETVEVALEVNRVLRSSRSDEFGLVFGKIGIKQP